MTRILLADPDPTARKALVLLLNHKLGLDDVSEATDNQELCNQLSDSPPDVLLIDSALLTSMSEKGKNLLQNCAPKLRLVVMSVKVEAAAQAQAMGAVFIHKGSSGAQVLKSLRTLLVI